MEPTGLASVGEVGLVVDVDVSERGMMRGILMHGEEPVPGTLRAPSVTPRPVIADRT